MATDDDVFEAWSYPDGNDVRWAWSCGDENHGGFPSLRKALEDGLARLGGEGSGRE